MILLYGIPTAGRGSDGFLVGTGHDYEAFCTRRTRAHARGYPMVQQDANEVLLPGSFFVEEALGRAAYAVASPTVCDIRRLK